AKILPLLKEPEQIFLIEKFIFNKTDKEIGKVLGITRQGATNLKHRLYKKIQKMLV
ncbi:sigma-70 family RNA polymerase sigma factor, partial [Enterococcus faecium]|nr:sigma-70 family RNA polymerase sigma factor [Enterococcus faecium]HBT4533970.1 sigma-70 family RNA polymerase sigma factor [Enterococcus faecium]